MHEILNYNRYKNQRPLENATVLFVEAIKLLCYNRSICLNYNIYSRQITVSKKYKTAFKMPENLIMENS